MIDSSELITFIKNNLPGGGIAGFGGFVHYLYKIGKGEKFSFSKLCINIVLAGWIGYICQEAGLSPIYISIAGFCAYPLLNMIEQKGPEILLSLLNIKK